MRIANDNLLLGANVGESTPAINANFAKTLGEETQRRKDSAGKDPYSEDSWQALVMVLTRAEMVPVIKPPPVSATPVAAPPAPIAEKPAACAAKPEPEQATPTELEMEPIETEAVPTAMSRIKTLRLNGPSPEDGPGTPVAEPTQVHFVLPEPATPNVVVAPIHIPAPVPVPAPAPVPTAAPIATAPAVPVEIPTERGHIGSTKAEIIIGEGKDQVAVRITAAGNQVRVEATSVSAGLAQALARGAGELRAALSRHGLELSELAQGPEDETTSDIKRVVRKNWTVA